MADDVARPLAPGTRTLLTLGAAVVVLAGVSVARDILSPLAIAVVLVIIVHPIRHPLERRGWPTWLATTAVIVVAYLILAVMSALIVLAAVQLSAILSEQDEAISALAAQLSELAARLGLDEQAVASAASVFDPATLLALAGTIVSTVFDWATAFFFVLGYVLFMAADGSRYARAGQVFGRERADSIGRVTRFNAGTRRFFVVGAIFGLIVAVLDGLLLWWLGLPGPLVWAILAFVTNFVPNIGFVLGLIPPAILALVVGGPGLFLVVVIAYIVINVTLQVLVQPRFVADTVSLSYSLTFFSVVFWTFVIGPVGAILAVPLTLLVRALLLEGDERSTWLRWLSGDPEAA
ncbi:AI-2E family transporter [Microterricola pindariensis]|uniref:AI-2E family transporter n=1 Tax=Microterricola pindariensis TaxID=478010 RepID=A0ABX5B007_9MICO|nr:AI-2E family transporter [Microterricola pindariensis]PPL20493.1 AI-2E family transporter [Microterricola pindariensis]